METALGTWGIRTVRDYSGLIDKVDRYEWTAWRRDNRIRLNGLVPNEQARRQVIGIVKASLPNLEVDDRLRLARGAPPTDIWLGGVGFGLKQLAQLKNGGRIDLDVASLSVAGEANDVRAYRSVKAALRGAMPPGITLKQDDVTAPVVKPHVWSARRTGDQLTLAGFVPNEKILEVIVAAARDGGVKLKVVDETQPGEGETEIVGRCGRRRCTCACRARGRARPSCAMRRSLLPASPRARLALPPPARSSSRA